MSLFLSEIVVGPTHLPVTVAAADEALAASVVQELELAHLWRAIVSQTRRTTVDGPLPARIELEPATITSINRWTSTDAASVIDAANYHVISRDPLGTVIVPLDGTNWPAPERSVGSFAITYMAGWEVSDTENHVPPTVKLMIERAIEYRSGGAGQGDIRIGSLEIDKPAAYQTDRLPRALTDIASAFFYRPGLFVGRP